MLSPVALDALHFQTAFGPGADRFARPLGAVGARRGRTIFVGAGPALRAAGVVAERQPSGSNAPGTRLLP